MWRVQPRVSCTPLPVRARNRRRSPLPHRARRWTARFMSLRSLSISLFGPNKCEIVSKPLYILQDLVTVTSTIAHPENWSRCQLVCWNNNGLVTSAIFMQLGGLVDAHYASMMCVPKSTLSASDGVLAHWYKATLSSILCQTQRCLFASPFPRCSYVSLYHRLRRSK